MKLTGNIVQRFAGIFEKVPFGPDPSLYLAEQGMFVCEPPRGILACSVLVSAVKVTHLRGVLRLVPQSVRYKNIFHTVYERIADTRSFRAITHPRNFHGVDERNVGDASM